MVYIVGRTRKEYLIGEVLFPKAVYNEEELARGRKTVVAVEDDLWAKMKDLDFVKELLASSAIEALDVAPADKFSTNLDLQAALTTSEEARVSLQDSLKKSEAELAKLQKKYDKLEKEALETIGSLQDKKKGS